MLRPSYDLETFLSLSPARHGESYLIGPFVKLVLPRDLKARKERERWAESVANGAITNQPNHNFPGKPRTHTSASPD